LMGLPGETIEALEAALVINGKAVALEAMGFPTSAKIQKGLGKKWTCSDNELLLFGDNLANALDGRDYGPTQFSEVTGTIVGLVKGE